MDPNQHHRPKKAEWSRENAAAPRKWKLSPLYHTHRHTHLLHSQTQHSNLHSSSSHGLWLTPREREQRYGHQMSRTVWDNVVQEWAKHTRTGKYANTHSQKQTNANTRRLHYHRKMRRAGCVRSENPKQRHFSCSWTPEIKCVELASPSTNPNLWTQNYTL